MNRGRPLAEVTQQIARESEHKRDYLAPQGKMRMIEAGQGHCLEVKELDVFGVREVAHEQIAATLGIPGAYYQRMRAEAPHLVTWNVNAWLSKAPAQERLLRINGTSLRAWLSGRYRPLDNDSVIETLGPIFEKYGDGLEVMSCELTERRLYIKIAYPALTGYVRKGDEVQSGFIISNSEVGVGALSVYPWLVRLACANGMKVEQAGERRAHLGRAAETNGAVIEYREDTQIASNKAIMLRVRDTVAACLMKDTFEMILAELRNAAASEEIERPGSAVVALGKQISLSADEQNSVLKHLCRHGDFTAWGMANAVTRIAEETQDYDRASELERLGYRVIGMATAGKGSAWEAIARAA